MKIAPTHERTGLAAPTRRAMSSSGRETSGDFSEALASSERIAATSPAKASAPTAPKHRPPAAPHSGATPDQPAASESEGAAPSRPPTSRGGPPRARAGSAAQASGRAAPSTMVNGSGAHRAPTPAIESSRGGGDPDGEAPEGESGAAGSVASEKAVADAAAPGANTLGGAADSTASGAPDAPPEGGVVEKAEGEPAKEASALYAPPASEAAGPAATGIPHAVDAATALPSSFGATAGSAAPLFAAASPGISPPPPPAVAPAPAAGAPVATGLSDDGAPITGALHRSRIELCIGEGPDRVGLRIAAAGHAVRIEAVVASAHLAAGLREAAPSLRADLGRHGLVLDQLSTSLGERHAPSQGGERSGMERPEATSTNPSEPSEPPPSTGVRVLA